MGCSSGFARFITSLTIVLALTIHPLAWSKCDFPAIFNLGDSNSDTGGLSSAFINNIPPYGETFFHKPAGRFSDGRLIIDFIAEGLGISYLHAYLDSVAPNFRTGANFATAASTILLPQSVLPLGGYSPFYLDIQYAQFTRLKKDSYLINKKGGIFKNLLPKDEYFAQALYTIDIGQNDIGAGLFANKSMEEIRASIPNIVKGLSSNIKSLYDQGGRSFWIHNTGPIGCLPYTFVIIPVPSNQMDSAGCAIPYNNLCQYFNEKLREAVLQLRNDLPLAAITYVDIYSVKYSLIKHATEYGFEKPLGACCGYGGEYNFNINIRCGDRGNINGTQIFVGSCKDPSVRVNWDGVHYTEAANKWIYEQIVGGKFSDPPVPLNMACSNCYFQ